MRKIIFMMFALFFLLTSSALAINSIYDIDTPSVIRGWHVTAADDDLSNTAALVTDEDAVYAQNDSAQTMEIVSDSTSDTTQTVTIYGISNDDKQISEEIEANGTTVVVGLKTFKYFDYAEIDAECAGNVTIQTVDDDDVTIIPAAAISSQVSQHFNGEKVSYITGWKAGVNTITANVTYTLRYYPDDAKCLDSDNSFIILDRIYIDGSVTSPYNAPPVVFAQPIRVPAGSWIAIFAVGSSDNGDGYVFMQGFDILEN